jgi:outer membrane protein assembly factor BamB
LSIQVRVNFVRILLHLPSWLVLLTGFSFGSPWTHAEETAQWTQFRGPMGQGLAIDAEPPLTWSEKKNVRWKTPIPGQGHSSPVIWGNQIWLTTAAADGKKLGVVCVDVETGRITQSVTVFTPDKVEEIHLKNSHASTTPVIEAGKLYVHFGTYGAAAIETSTGSVLWKNEDLQIEHQGGPGSSPVLYKENLIVTCDGADRQYVAALDTKTGKERWKRLRSAPLRDNPVTHRAFATPLLIEYQGEPQVICPGADQLHAYHPGTGAEIWHVRYTGFSTVPCPAFDGERVYFCTGYFEPELWAVKPDGQGDVTATHVAWKYKNAVPDTPSPLIYDGRLYTVSDKGVGTCLNAETGKRLATFRLNGSFSASPLLAGGHIFCCSEEGKTRVVLPGDKPKIVENNELPGRIMASPAAIGRSLYLRTDDGLYRIESAESASP